MVLRRSSDPCGEPALSAPLTLPEPNVALMPETTSPWLLDANTMIESRMLAIARKKSVFWRRK